MLPWKPGEMRVRNEKQKIGEHKKSFEEKPLALEKFLDQSEMNNELE